MLVCSAFKASNKIWSVGLSDFIGKIFFGFTSEEIEIDS